METFEELEEALRNIAIKVEDTSDKITDENFKSILITKFEIPSFSPLQRREFYFNNDRSISVIRGYGSYGYEKGLFEVAVLDKQGILDYSTKITNDVIGHCNIKKIVKIAKQVNNLR